jgi:hypothetical protein
MPQPNRSRRTRDHRGLSPAVCSPGYWERRAAMMIRSSQSAIRVRAAWHEPDMFYVNRCMPSIKDRLFG